MSCILVFYLAIPGIDVGALSARARSETNTSPIVQGTTDPDALYAKREDIGSAQQAANIWQSRLQQNPNDFESAWKLARASYWIGTQGPEPQRRATLEQGVTAGRTATRLEPNKAEGHMWLAASMGALAESFGLRQGLKYRGEIRSELETVLRIDPAFEQGSADRALGRWYYKVPGLFGGSKEKSEEHLRQSLKYGPESTASHFFLAETLLDSGRRDEGRAELQRVLDAPLDPDWTPEDREWKEKARQRLNGLK